MMDKDEIVETLTALKGEEVILHTLEKMANMDSQHRSKMVDFLLLRFQQEQREPQLIALTEQMKVDSFCPILLSLIEEVRHPTNPSLSPKNLLLLNIFVIVLLGSFMIFFLKHQFQEHEERIGFWIARNESLRHELNNFELQEEKKISQEAQNRSHMMARNKKLITGSWTNFHVEHDGYTVDVTYGAAGNFKSTSLQKGKVEQVRGKWRLESPDVILCQFKNEDGKLINNRLKLIHVDSNTLIYRDQGLKIRRRTSPFPPKE